MSIDHVKSEVQGWLKRVVIGLELCPFASRVLEQDSIRYHVCNKVDSQDALDDLKVQLELLEQDSAIETTLIILTDCLQDFLDYNDFLDWVDLLLLKSGWEGCFQIASFHPDYCFADVAPDSAENLTNRSPYPILHILREKSLEKAIEAYPDADNIPVRNIEKVNNLTDQQKLELFPYLFKK